MPRGGTSEWAHAHLPPAVVDGASAVRASLFWARLCVQAAPRWLRLARAARPLAGVHVYYGRDRAASRDGAVVGGAVKLTRLADSFPNEPRAWNLIYLASSALPADALVAAGIAKARGARVVVNQDGVLYPGLGMPGWERSNRRNARLLHAADHVFFQSAFAKESADRFLGERADRWEILHNAVDTSEFVPDTARRPSELTLVLGGSQYQRYRVETALRTLALLPDARLVITGALTFAPDAHAVVAGLADTLGVRSRLELLGPYAQRDAPRILQSAHLLLHTKVNDPCPGIVIEAMACGLPIVCSASGGMPELVGDDAGIGIPTPLDFEVDRPPAPEDLAEAVRRVTDDLERYASAARRRAVERFDLAPWLERHRAVFEDVLAA